ncbi:hypothetical protein HWV07_11820 [Natronomonas salina]|uniref:hypothetical protein n=1 Tax=Natronomonas salina TaxID=1710540 RepID=UPI0015B6577C|nr:hypothetical protein [Natronomonas salina]QLD89673.1 hypothetical protein HWV07_11820 [Natronomonas salina]
MPVASSEDSFQLFEESLPVFAVVFLWTLLAVFARYDLGSGLRYAGLVMALLYVVVRGAAVGRSVETVRHPTSVVDGLRDSVRSLAPASPWFLLAFALRVGRDYTGFVLPSELVYVSSATGVLTVVLYAAVFGSARLRATWR